MYAELNDFHIWICNMANIQTLLSISLPQSNLELSLSCRADIRARSCYGARPETMMTS